MSMSSELAAGIGENDLHVGSYDRSVKVGEDIPLKYKMISACLGSLITSLVVTPFDVIRIRIQQQEILPDHPCCEAHFPPKNTGGSSTLLKEHKLPGGLQTMKPSELELFWISKNYCKSAENCSKITSTFQGFVTISKNEGVSTLWRGLSITLLMAIPSNIIYFTGYEYIRDNSLIKDHPLNPLLCGSLARTLSATFVSPLELIKTRLQSIPTSLNSGSTMLSTLLRDLAQLVRTRGISTLFTGLQITLWRDVPFSGIYWSSYEFFKSQIGSYLNADFNAVNSDNNDWKVFTTSFLSGSISGTIAALFTNPFDVGKTRLQITSQKQSDNGKNGPRPSMFNFLVQIYKKEGLGSLYSGFGPRVIKIAPSCAIMISSYEIGKKIFKKGNAIE